MSDFSDRFGSKGQGQSVEKSLQAVLKSLDNLTEDKNKQAIEMVKLLKQDLLVLVSKIRELENNAEDNKHKSLRKVRELQHSFSTENNSILQKIKEIKELDNKDTERQLKILQDKSINLKNTLEENINRLQTSITNVTDQVKLEKSNLQNIAESLQSLRSNMTTDEVGLRKGLEATQSKLSEDVEKLNKRIDEIKPMQGPPGLSGSRGRDGKGVASGGTTGQVLAKASDSSFDTEWIDAGGGGGSGNVTASANLGDNLLIRGNGPAKGIQNSGITVDDSDNLSGIGNISLTGTIDGRDIATDGAKLDGIESGATSDQTAEEIQDLAWNVLTGTQTGITVTYQDGTNDVDFVVDNVDSLSTSLTAGSVVFSNGSTLSEDNTNLFWDDTNNRLGIGGNTSPLDTVDITGALIVDHLATVADDHALEVDVDAAGFGDVKAIDVAYTTGAITDGQDEAVVLVNIDESVSGGGDVFAFEALTTDVGSANVYGLRTGATVNAVCQLSGTFNNADSISVNAVDQLTALSSGGVGNVSIFISDNDTGTIGLASKFEEIEIILDTVSSGGGIAPTFEFSTGPGTWSTFTPVDGTNGFRNTGLIIWDDTGIPSWAVGTGSEYLIRITRTKNNLSTTPIADLIQVSTLVEHKWDNNGELSINAIKTTKTSGDTLLLQAYDVDGLAYTTFGTLTANNTPTFDLSSAVTVNGETITTASTADTLTNKSGNISQWTNDSGYITATLTDEQVEDIVGGMVTGNTETGITVTYEDVDGTLDFVVNSASTSTSGISELATTAEVDTGTDTGRTITPDALAGSYAGTKIITFIETDPTASLTTGDGKAYVHVPASLNGMDIVSAHAEVITAGVTGTLDIQIHNVTGAVDIFSTKLTVDSNETGSDTAATPVVINTANDDLSTNDVLRLDIDAIHSGTAPQGLIVTLECRLP